MSELSGYHGPPRFLTDANFNLHIVAGLRRLRPTIDVVTSQQMGILSMSDPELLRYAQAADRILLSHDRKTMPGHLRDSLLTLAPDTHSPGVMSLEQQLAVGQAIQAIHLVWECSTHDEWRDQYVFLPL